MVITTDSIHEQFLDMGIDPSREILEKCVKICQENYVNDPEEFVEQWMAFSLSNLGGKEPTIDYMKDFERKEFLNKNVKESERYSPKKGVDDLMIYNSATDGKDAVDIRDEIMDVYSIYQTPKAKKPAALRNENSSTLSPASFSPVTASTQLIGTPNIPGNKVVNTFGRPDMIKNFNYQENIPALKVSQIPLNEMGKHLRPSERCCFDKFYDKCELDEIRTNQIGKKICAKNLNEGKAHIDLNDYEELSMPGISHQHDITCIGRISCDCDGRMNEASTILIGSDSVTLRFTHLNLEHLNSFSLFPGQIVLVTGRNATADQLYVNRMCTETAIELPNLENNLPTPINVVVAAGPFTFIDDLSYTPFKLLLDHCKKEKPNILILIGPFIDSDNKLIMDGIMAEDFNSFFEKLLLAVTEAVGDNCKVLVGASCNDARSFVYPTPPNKPNKRFPNVCILPDPCLVDVNGFLIGMTSVDVLQHLLDCELVRQPSQDKIKRTVNYLFHQRSFYPLNPPHPDVMFDSRLATIYTSLNKVPNMLILPGKMKCFVRDINNCLVVNPGRLADINGGGTFATIVINPVNSTITQSKLSDYIACQVLKI